MQISGSNPRSNDWTSFIPNGGFGVKRPTPLVGMVPSPIAVNFLQEELGHTMSPKSADFAFMSRSSHASKLSAYGAERAAAQSDTSWGMEMQNLMGLGSGKFGFPSGEENQESRAIQALADLFICPATTFPLSIGLFYDSVNSATTPNSASSSLAELEENLRVLLHLNTKALPTFCAPLVWAPTLLIFILSYLLAIAVKFEVGLSLGILGIFMHFLILLTIAIGKKCFDLRVAWNASLTLSAFARQITLFTKFLFYYPRRKFNSLNPVKIQIVSYRLSQSPNTPHLVLTLIQLMWRSMERQYNPVVVRLQRFMHASTLPMSTKRAYKRICCLPAFVVVTLVTISILIDLLLLRIFDFNPLEMLKDMRVLPIFVIMSSIIFLGFCASVPSVVNGVFAYLYRPKTRLDKAIAMYSASKCQVPVKNKKRFPLMDTLTARITNGSDETKPNGNCLQSSLEVADVLPVTSSCEVDILAKKEFANVCDMIHAFNFYLQGMEQTRLVVMIDASDITSPVQLAGVFYQVHSLLLTQPNAPVAVVIATNIAAFYEKPSCALTSNDIVFQESQAGESIEALNLLRSISDCNHLILFSVQLPIFLDTKTVKADSSALKRLPGASSLVTLLHNSMKTSPVIRTFSPIGLEEANGEPLRKARSRTSVGSNAGQINQAFTSAEEIGAASQEAIGEANSVMKAAQSNTSLSVQNQQTQMPSTNSAPSTVVKNVNTSRLNTTRAAAKGIAEIFLTNEEMVEQNVPVIRTLVAETAFTNRLIKLNSSTISIKQLVNWIYLTQHWPFHMTWMTILLEKEGLDVFASKETVEDDVSSPLRANPNPLSSLVSKTLEEVATLPPVVSILSGDDRDPTKLLHFVLNQIDCQYSLTDLWHLVDNSLFLNPIFRVCIKEIRGYCFGEGGQGGYAEPNMFHSDAIITNERPEGTRRDFCVTAPVSHSLETMPQCFDPNINSRAVTVTAVAAGKNTDSSADTRSPLPLSLNSEHCEKGLCLANPLNSSISPTCPIRLKCSIPGMVLSKMNVDDICLLLSAISDLPSGNCSTYQMHVRSQNINGQVLSVCDLTKLRSELQMSFGDWQLLNTFIMYLRSLETCITDRSRNSQDVKSPHGSYPYSQVLVSHPPFVLCNEQSQTRGKTMFDVPVLVQPVPLESNMANLRQNTDRTTSDFSFGSGTDEFELAWRRDAKPDSLNGKTKSQQERKDATFRQISSHANPVWVESVHRLSKSTHDLLTGSTSKRSQGHPSSSKSDERRVERPPQRTDKPTQVFQSTSSAPDHLVQMVPAYISRAPETSAMIPVWYPTLHCVGEASKPQQSFQGGGDYSSESSSASVDGTYDFPSEYSSEDRHSQQHKQSYRQQQCPPSCPHSHREHRRRRKSSRSSRSSNRTAQRSSSRRNSLGRCSQKSVEGCTCDYLLHQECQSPRISTAVNPWTTRSPRKISSPDLSDIEAMTSS